MVIGRSGLWKPPADWGNATGPPASFRRAADVHWATMQCAKPVQPVARIVQSRGISTRSKVLTTRRGKKLVDQKAGSSSGCSSGIHVPCVPTILGDDRRHDCIFARPATTEPRLAARANAHVRRARFWRKVRFKRAARPFDDNQIRRSFFEVSPEKLSSTGAISPARGLAGNRALCSGLLWRWSCITIHLWDRCGFRFSAIMGGFIMHRDRAVPHPGQLGYLAKGLGRGNSSPPISSVDGRASVRT